MVLKKEFGTKDIRVWDLSPALRPDRVIPVMELGGLMTGQILTRKEVGGERGFD